MVYGTKPFNLLLTFYWLVVSIIKVKRNPYRSPEGSRSLRGSQISKQSAHVIVKVVSPIHRQPLPQDTFLVLISVRGSLDPSFIVRPEGFFQLKIPITPTVYEKANLWIASQCFSQMRHHWRINCLASRSLFFFNYPDDGRHKAPLIDQTKYFQLAL